MSLSDLRTIAKLTKIYHQANIGGMRKPELRHLLGSMGGILPGWDHPRHWIQKAIKRPGAFRKFAAEHHGMDASGKIKPAFIQHIIDNPPTPRLKKQAVLAQNLRSFHKIKAGCYNPDSKQCPMNKLRRALEKIQAHSK